MSDHTIKKMLKAQIDERLDKETCLRIRDEVKSTDVDDEKFIDKLKELMLKYDLAS